MLPERLCDSYKQYKSDTNKIVTWLFETAQKCGFVSDTASVHSESMLEADHQPKTKKLKGRARKLARDAAEAAATATATKNGHPSSTNHNRRVNGPPGKYTVKTKDFVPMATQIVACHEPWITVPTHMVETFKKTIFARRQFSQWFAAEPEADGAAAHSSDGHLYFIRVLEDTFAVLGPRILPDRQPHKAPNSRSQQRGTKSAMKANSHGSRFEPLTVEDVDEDACPPAPHQVNSVEQNKKEKIMDVTYEPEEDEWNEEFLFAAYCMVNDMNQVRQYLSELWLQYFTGEVDLAIAATTTNVAFNLVRRTEDDFASSVKWPREFDEARPTDIIPALLCSKSLSLKNPATGATIDVDERNRNLDDGDGRAADAIWSFYWIDMLVLISCRRGVPELTQIYQHRISLVKANKKFAEDFLLLRKTLPHFASLGKLSPEMPFRDELSLSVWQTVEHENRISSMFAVQVWLDINKIMSPDPGRAMVDARRAVARMQHTFEDHADFQVSLAENLQERDLAEAMSKTLKGFQSLFNGDWEARIGKFVEELSPEIPVQMKIDQAMKQDEIIRAHPVFCGLVRYHCFVQLQKAGLQWCNISRSIFSAIHLYNALRVEEDLICWPDLDLMISFQTKEHLFLGEAPKSIEDALKRWYLLSGVKAETFAKGRRKNKPATSIRNLRHLKEASTLARILTHRCQHCDCGSSSTMKDIKEVLNIEHCVNHLSEKDNQLSSMQLLQALKSALSAEAPALLFDYFTLNQQCTRFWLDLAETFKTKSTACWTVDYQSGRISGGVATGQMIPNILRHACDVRKAPNLLPFKRCSCMTRVPLQIAGERLEEIARDDGSREIAKLKQRVPDFA